MRYDLHIHSALSPCANDDMTPNNIINMAKLCGLDTISVCDHNSLKQQEVMGNVAEKLKITYIYGVEVQSMEEVHLCGYFRKKENAFAFQKILDENIFPIMNDIHYFGNQLLMNEFDEVSGVEDILLLQSVNMSVEEVCEAIHACQGLVSLAHVCDKSNSILTQLGFIPKNLKFDFIEIKDESQKEMVVQSHPRLENICWIVNSDAHYLWDIDKYESEMSDDVWRKKWGI